MGDLKGKVIYKKNAQHYNLKYIANDFTFVAFEKLTYKKLFTRHVRNEIVTYTSQELKSGSRLFTKPIKPALLPQAFVVVDKLAYDDAVSNLSAYPKR